MQSKIAISKTIQELLCCPVCRAKLDIAEEQCVCTSPTCAAVFPVLDGVPVILNEKQSLFSIEDFFLKRNTTTQLHQSKVRQTISRLIPSISLNLKAKKHFDCFLDNILQQALPYPPRILIIGGSILGAGLETLAMNRSIDLVESDVSFGPRTMLICDAHDIPFDNDSFDGVIAQAVLEHVVDPYRCTEEIHRVLKTDGLIYAETPFMQQVHGGRYDFTRFTHVGHRRLFRRFKEIDSGAMCGPGMALA